MLQIVDVGYGCGDSLLLHLKHPSVPRPSLLVGITSLQEHHKRSLERTTKAEPGTKVELYHGDAVYHTEMGKRKHPLDPSSEELPFTSILALDCAYHFRTRQDFLHQSFARLSPGGHIALADMCFGTTGKPSRWFKLLGLLGVVPQENIVTTEKYLEVLRAVGYTEGELEDISANVFPGFCKFLATQGTGWVLFSRLIGMLSASGMRFVIVKASKPV